MHGGELGGVHEDELISLNRRPSEAVSVANGHTAPHLRPPLTATKHSFPRRFHHDGRKSLLCCATRLPSKHMLSRWDTKDSHTGGPFLICSFDKFPKLDFPMTFSSGLVIQKRVYFISILTQFHHESHTVLASPT